jgi:syndecan 4
VAFKFTSFTGATNADKVIINNCPDDTCIRRAGEDFLGIVSVSPSFMYQSAAYVANKGYMQIIFVAGDSAVSGFSGTWTLGTPGMCRNCAVATYSGTTGVTVCANCPTNSISPLSSTAIAACVANAGYSGQGSGPFTPCSAGKFKAVSGPQACTDCQSGTYSALTGSPECTDCPTPSMSPPASTTIAACVANAICPAGTYFAVTPTCSGNTASCCTTGMASISGTSGTVSEGQPNDYANNMVCNWIIGPSSNARFTFSAFDLEQGYDWVTLYDCPDAACSSQSMIVKLTQGATVVSNTYTAYAGYMKIVFTSDSDTGYNGFSGTWNLSNPLNRSCYRCIDGTYSGTNDATACTDCGQGTYSAADRSSCVACPADSFAPARSTACLCNTDYQGGVA